MLFALAVLSVLLITAGAQEQECHLAKWLIAVYVKFFNAYKQSGSPPAVIAGHHYLKWNMTMSDQALQEATVRGSVITGDDTRDPPYIILQHKQEFRKKDRLKEKVRHTLESNELILQADVRGIANLHDYANFGCNGKAEAKDDKGDKEYMNIVCFFENY